MAPYTAMVKDANSGFTLYGKADLSKSAGGHHTCAGEECQSPGTPLRTVATAREIHPETIEPEGLPFYKERVPVGRCGTPRVPSPFLREPTERAAGAEGERV